MQEAFGGVLNIFLIAIFLAIVEAVLAFAVCYTKAFRMKNYVISAVEQYEGIGCMNGGLTGGMTACRQRIQDYANGLKYAPVNLQCHNDSARVDGLYCISEIERDSSRNSVQYRIVTQVDVNLPIINNIMGLEFFLVSGDTRSLRIPS